VISTNAVNVLLDLAAPPDPSGGNSRSGERCSGAPADVPSEPAGASAKIDLREIAYRMADIDKAMKAIAEARKQATNAYVFTSGSRTYSALSACMAAELALREELFPDWIAGHRCPQSCHTLTALSC
jgi:hypothetical protein